MATPEQCPFYDKCGFVHFRIEHPDAHSPVLPEDGDCGKPYNSCGRANPVVPIDIEAPGPVTWDEIDIIYPETVDPHSGKKHRLVGGAFK